EALTLVRDECPDLLIVDIAAPDMDGCRFVVQMRCEPRLPQPRVLMRAVAGVEAEARALAHAFGASFVVKPTNPELLLATVSATAGDRAPPQRGPPADGQPGETIAQPSARLLRRVAERSAQLEVARTALDLEIKKRIWAEHDLIHATQRLDDQAVRDPVTGLYNRRFLEEAAVVEARHRVPHGLIVQPLRGVYQIVLRPDALLDLEIEGRPRHLQLGAALRDASQQPRARLRYRLARLAVGRRPTLRRRRFPDRGAHRREQQLRIRRLHHEGGAEGMRQGPRLGFDARDRPH